MVLHNCLYNIIAMSIKTNGNVARKWWILGLNNVIKTRATTIHSTVNDLQFKEY